MKFIKYIFIIIALSFGFSLNAQVFVSKITGEIYLGPANFTGNIHEYGTKFQLNLSLFLEKLGQVRQDNQKEIEKLLGRKRLNKKKKLKLQVLKSENKYIDIEMADAKRIDLLWNTVLQTFKLSTTKEKYPSKCFIVQTNLGEFFLNQLELKSITSKRPIQNKMTIDIITDGKKKGWVKKESAKDIWCLELIDNQFYYDINKQKIEFNKCPESLNYSEKDHQCVKYLSEGENETIEIKVKESGKAVSIISWEMEDCK